MLATTLGLYHERPGASTGGDGGGPAAKAPRGAGAGPRSRGGVADMVPLIHARRPVGPRGVLAPDELEGELSRLGAEPYHGRQIYRWVYRRGLEGFDGMTDLSRPLREALARTLSFSTPRIETHTTRTGRELSGDGTRKFLFTLSDGRGIESVFIPDTPAMTFCVSTQVGCAMGCRFCLTGKMGLVRHLTAGETWPSRAARLSGCACVEAAGFTSCCGPRTCSLRRGL